MRYSYGLPESGTVRARYRSDVRETVGCSPTRVSLRLYGGFPVSCRTIYTMVVTATKTMNCLGIIRRQMIRQKAIRDAQKLNASTLCYRGNCYAKQV
jgi:hypothetical protein